MPIYGGGACAHDPGDGAGPERRWNGKKVYLSPSSQSANVGCDGYNEKDGARAIAAKVKD